MRHVARPCTDCPWRRDAPLGHFPPERYAALTNTVAAGPGREAPMGAPMFACHASQEGRESACAGWLAVAGVGHLGVRVAAASDHLPFEALSPGEGWPALYTSFEEMVAAQTSAEITG